MSKVRDDKKKPPKITASDVGIALSIFFITFPDILPCHTPKIDLTKSITSE